MEYLYWHEMPKDRQNLYKEIKVPSQVHLLNTLFTSSEFIRSEISFLEDCIYFNNIHLEGLVEGANIVFKNCVFAADVIIKGNCYGKLSFHNCIFQGEILIEISELSSMSIDLIDILVYRQLRIQNGKFDYIKASFKRFPTIKLNGGSFKELYFGYWGHDTEIKDLFIDSEKIEGIFQCINSTIIRLHLSGNNKKGEFYFEAIQLTSFTIYRFRNEGWLRIQNIYPYKETADAITEIVVYDSKLANTEFYETNFELFDKIIFHDSLLFETIFVNIDWPTEILPYGGKYIDEKEKRIPDNVTFFKKRKDVYRQIKFAYNKQGDKIKEHYFHGLEMSDYNKTLQWKAKNLGNKLVIHFSKTFSDFGQSMSKPLIWLFLVPYLFYVAMIYFYSYKGFYIAPLKDSTWKAVIDAFAELLRLLNPLHKNEPELSGGLLIIDIVIRVWCSYMIYNVIRATRRFII